MKRSLFVFANLVLVLALVLSFGIAGCTGTEETTPPPEETSTPPPEETTTPPPEETTTPPPEETTTPPPETTPAEPVSISWEDTANYIGVLVTVEGTIIDYIDSGSAYVLGMGVSVYEANTVGIEISYALAAELPEDLYVGQTVQVTGTPYTNPYGGASIVVSDASKIVVVGGPPPEETTTPPPEETTTPAVASVYVSVSLDGELLVAAQPVAYTEGMTVDDVIAAAHEAYYADGINGYTTYTDPTWGYMISQCWGVQQAPYIIVNDAPTQASVNAIAVAENDNIIIYAGTTVNSISPVSLTATVSDDTVTITATAWTFSWTTFVWSSAPLADATVIDPTTGEVLGTTDANGQLTITIPASGIVAIDGMAAINVNASAT